MSIRSELNNTKHYLRESRKAILGRGGEISEKAGLKDIPEAVWSIPADTSLAFREDSEVAYEKVVPVGAEEYALVKRVGGMNLKLYSTNLCTADGVYECSGSEATIPLGAYNLEDGQYYLSIDTSNLKDFYEFELRAEGYGKVGESGFFNTSLTFTFSDNLRGLPLYMNIRADSYYFTYEEGATDLSGFVQNIMLCKADDADKTYKPYQPPEFVTVKPTSLESRGAQLLNMACPTSTPNPSTGGTDTKRIFEPNTCIVGMARNNIYNPDNVKLESRTETSFTATSLNAFYGVAFALKLQPNTNYYLTYEGETAVDGNPIYVSYTFYDNDGTYLKADVKSTREISFTTDNYGNVLILFSSILNSTFTVSNIMLNRGTEAVPYKPYSAEPIDTFALPEAVQSLDGWGLGVNAEYNNHIEIRNGRIIYVQMCAEGRLDETLGWRAYTANQYPEGVYCYYVTNAKPNGKVGYQTSICSHFNNVNGVWGASTGTVGDYSDHSSYSWIYVKTDKATVEEWKSYLATNDVRLVYALETPIETDITHLFTDTSPFLKVQGGGGVIAHNERKEAVPSTLKYTIKVG